MLIGTEWVEYSAGKTSVSSPTDNDLARDQSIISITKAKRRISNICYKENTVGFMSIKYPVMYFV
jgi:hypothetical protein